MTAGMSRHLRPWVCEIIGTQVCGKMRYYCASGNEGGWEAGSRPLMAAFTTSRLGRFWAEKGAKAEAGLEVATRLDDLFEIAAKIREGVCQALPLSRGPPTCFKRLEESGKSGLPKDLFVSVACGRVPSSGPDVGAAP